MGMFSQGLASGGDGNARCGFDGKTRWGPSREWSFVGEGELSSRPLGKGAPEEIFFAAINYNTGKKESFSNPDSIIEALKLSDIEKMKNKNLNRNPNYDSLSKFRQFY